MSEIVGKILMLTINLILIWGFLSALFRRDMTTETRVAGLFFGIIGIANFIYIFFV